MRTRLLVQLVLLLLTAVAAAAAVVLVTGGERAAQPPPADTYVSEHLVEVPEELRTVTVSSSMPLPSADAETLSAMLVSGPMPASGTTATVLTDTECTPDEQMVSRCRNELRLRDGRKVVLRHPHDMRDVPCLAPGEQVRLLALGA